MSPIYDILYNKVYPNNDYQPQNRNQRLGSTISNLGNDSKRSEIFSIKNSRSNIVSITNVVNNKSIVYKISNQSPQSTRKDALITNNDSTTFVSTYSDELLSFDRDNKCECDSESCEECETTDTIDYCTFAFEIDPVFDLNKIDEFNYEISKNSLESILGSSGYTFDFRLLSGEKNQYLKIIILSVGTISGENTIILESEEGLIESSFSLPPISGSNKLEKLLITIQTGSCTNYLFYCPEPPCPTETTTTPPIDELPIP